MTRQNSATLAEHFRRPQLFLPTLSVLTFIVYYTTLSFAFAWDDIPQISNNPVVRSWANIPRAFTTDLWFHVHRGQLYYRPLFTTWSIFNYSLFQLHPWGWHLTAVLLHIVTVSGVYLLARRLELPYWTAAAATALFALHPVHIECIAWISAASDTMVTLFYILAFAAFLQSRRVSESQKTPWTISSIAIYCLALLSKEMAVTFFLVVGVYVWLFPSRGAVKFGEKLREAGIVAVPYLVVGLGYLVLRKSVLHSVIADPTMRETALSYVLVAPYVLMFYLRILLIPLGLTGLYYTPVPVPGQYHLVVIAVLVLVAYVALIRAWYKRSGDRMVLFLAWWPLLTLAPALYLPNFSNGDFVRDRYIYLPSVGFILLAAKAIRLMPAVAKISVRTVQVAMAVLVLLGFTALNAQQIYWDNELEVFQRGHDLYPDSNYARVGLARMLEQGGKNDQAIDLLLESIRQKPNRPPAYYLLAEAYSRIGDMQKGKLALAQALARTSDPTEGEMEIADLAGLYSRLGEFDQAIQLCNLVLAKEPDLLTALYNCGNANFQLARYSEAEKLLSHAVAVAPGEPAALYWLGRVYLETGRLPEAQAAFRKVLAIQPDIYEYHYRFAETLEKAGDAQSAKQEYREALRFDPLGEGAKSRLSKLETSVH